MTPRRSRSQSGWPATPNGLARRGLTEGQRAWLEAQGFKGAARKHVLLPGPDGALAGAVLGLGEERSGDPMDKPELAVGLLPGLLPPGCYHLADDLAEPELAAVAWGLGAYRFRRYKSAGGDEAAQLKVPRGVDPASALAQVEAVWLGRDLINTPASDMGPQELEDAARQLAKMHGADVSSIVGDELLAKNFPMIHAVGRASPRAPRLIDLTWGRAGAKQITLVGKGIAFDTGGLDIKPASGMLIMKKDMGGAASALALGHMVMAAKLDVRLRILIPAAENSIAGNAFRPGDVLASRAGRTVEIGNTDAEGRLVLADALALADEERPDCGRQLRHADRGRARGARARPAAALLRRRCPGAGHRRRRQPRWRSGVAHAVLVRLRGQPRQRGRRHEQRQRVAVRRLGDGGAVPAPVRQAGRALRASRHLRLAPGGQAAGAQGRRAAGRARPVRGAAHRRAVRDAKDCRVTSHGPLDSRIVTHLDRRRNAYRADLAAESLRGKVAAPRYAAGEARQVIDAAVPLRDTPDAHARWTTEALFGERVTVLRARATAGPGCNSPATATSATCRTRPCPPACRRQRTG